jgi:hypothetical protein
MNGDICAARKLLAELREAYRSLPKTVQTHLTSILRGATIQNDLGGGSQSQQAPHQS